MAVGQLIPWFVWCMLPLALANVLLNNLLAHKAYRVIPWLIVVVAAYASAAYILADPVPDLKTFAHFKRIIQIVGVSNLAFLAVCAFFTTRLPAAAKEEPAAI
jgi:hypothetical protein